MRSLIGTKSALPSFVVLVTKSIIACFDAPSFHDASGSIKTAAISALAVSIFFYG
jgi:hypothetical protein